ncbi:MAG: glutamyl-tRNA amidotransferase [Flavobacteriales bacterium CG_4_9_14_0_2_um_filter_35_242]|nr:GatB/YqeY domain-containing protein [Zetaproteobacteria bacterium]OIO09723.1 MAG: glutamyl-tRNA amidotransferase [Flavobacteriaceae bacterium CG1_02_35_72]PIX06480.1 MAG: glutamyl-tRNA amidotransferase [Flavobacteriales bacterium CG_4_8_14_3_um_filter_35_10]PJC60392.1 MAG: glutamyl-tRNA amidotransferase [Flavobacteriales bacterium CG_4_9_14_0_2_um_filter_35_242]
MSLQANVMDALKEAMKSKDKVALEALRAIKSALLLAQTSGTQKEVDEAEELAILQRLVKQRKESAAIYLQQNRTDLAEPELAQVEIIAQFLPSQMNEEALKAAIAAIIAQSGASSIKDMGKVMGLASKQLAGKADGKAISNVVKQLLG